MYLPRLAAGVRLSVPHALRVSSEAMVLGLRPNTRAIARAE